MSTKRKLNGFEETIKDNNIMEVIDVFQLQKGLIVLGCIIGKKNNAYKVYLYIEKDNNIISKLYEKKFSLENKDNAMAYFSNLKKMVTLNSNEIVNLI